MSVRAFHTASALINVMVKAVSKAAQGLRRDFGEVAHLQVSVKGPKDFVSVADHRVERTLQQELSKARPDFGFIMEESGVIPGKDDHTWVIDPLDGTMNFLHGVPHFCISVGVLEGKVPVAGVIYDPLRDEIFWAERGGGCFVNSQKIRVARRGDLSTALFGISHYPYATMPKGPSLFGETTVRTLGSAALDLAYVAAGRLDGYAGRNLKIWDIAAGYVLVSEALGMVTDWSGRACDVHGGEILATNGLTTARVIELLRQDRPAQETLHQESHR